MQNRSTFTLDIVDGESVHQSQVSFRSPPITCDLPITYRELKSIIQLELQKYDFRGDFHFYALYTPKMKQLQDEQQLTPDIFQDIFKTHLLPSIVICSGNKDFNKLRDAIEKERALSYIPLALNGDEIALKHLLPFHEVVEKDLPPEQGKQIVDLFFLKIDHKELGYNFISLTLWHSRYPSSTEQFIKLHMEIAKKDLQRGYHPISSLKFPQQEATKNEKVYNDCLELFKHEGKDKKMSDFLEGEKNRFIADVEKHRIAAKSLKESTRAVTAPVNPTAQPLSKLTASNTAPPRNRPPMPLPQPTTPVAQTVDSNVIASYRKPNEEKSTGFIEFFQHLFFSEEEKKQASPFSESHQATQKGGIKYEL